MVLWQSSVQIAARELQLCHLQTNGSTFQPDKPLFMLLPAGFHTLLLLQNASKCQEGISEMDGWSQYIAAQSTPVSPQ